MRRIPTVLVRDGAQEEAQDQFYQPKIQQRQEDPQKQQQDTDHLQRIEEHTFGMASWATKLSPNLYAGPPRFRPNFQEYFNEQCDHMPIQNLREHFATIKYMEAYFKKQDQALAHKRDQMRITQVRQNQSFQDTVEDVRNYFNSDNM